MDTNTSLNTIIDLEKEKDYQVVKDIEFSTYHLGLPEKIIVWLGTMEKDLDEPFEHGATFYIVGKLEKEIVGIIAYRMISINGVSYPRFVQIIIDPKFRHTRNSIKFYRYSDIVLFTLGFKQIIVVIGKNLLRQEFRKKMTTKNGYKEYHEDEQGVYYFKNIRSIK